MDVHPCFKIRTFVLNTTTWTPIIVPTGAFSRVVLENTDSGNAVSVCTDKETASVKSLPASQELDVFCSQDGPFTTGQTVCYAKATSGASVIVASFTR